jgi:hypothetical protein
MPTRTVPSKTQLAKDANSRKLAARLSALKALATRKLAAMKLEIEPSTTESLDLTLTSLKKASKDCTQKTFPENPMAPEPVEAQILNLKTEKKSDTHRVEPYRGLTPNSMASQSILKVADITTVPKSESVRAQKDFGQIISAENVSETILAPDATLNGSSEGITDDAVESLSASSTAGGTSISFPMPLNSDCTFENALYPFKLVLSPAEERPLEIGTSPLRS